MGEALDGAGNDPTPNGAAFVAYASPLHRVVAYHIPTWSVGTNTGASSVV